MTSEWTAIFQAGLPQIGALGPQRRMAAERGLWRLLAVQATRYTMGDSSSVALETAENLLESLCFTLGAYFDQGAEGPEALLRGGLDGLLERAQNALERKVEAGKALWKRACLSLPEVESVSLRDTLKGSAFFSIGMTGGFWPMKSPDILIIRSACPCPAKRRGSTISWLICGG